MLEEEVEKEKISGFRVTEHIYVPKHEILSEEEAQELLKRLHARPEQLPYIRASDPGRQRVRRKTRSDTEDNTQERNGG
jgi:DNA-directed RNA polymerase subunit H